MKAGVKIDHSKIRKNITLHLEISLSEAEYYFVTMQQNISDLTVDYKKKYEKLHGYCSESDIESFKKVFMLHKKFELSDFCIERETSEKDN